MKTIIGTILVCLCSFGLIAQSEEEVTRNVFNEVSSGGLREGAPYYALNKDPVEVEGSYFLEEEWKDAVVLSLSGELYQVKARYNAQQDEMQIFADGQVRALFPQKMKGIAFGEQVFVPGAFSTRKGGMELGYFELLSEGKIRLLKRYTTTMRRKDYHPVLGSSGNDMEIVIQETLYYQKLDKPAVKLKRNRGGVLDALSRKRKAVNEYARRNLLKWKKEEDLKRLFDFYNGKE